MLSIIGLSSKSVEQHDEEYRDLEPAAFESCGFIGQRAGSNFHSVPHICFPWKQFELFPWEKNLGSLVFISLANS